MKKIRMHFLCCTCFSVAAIGFSGTSLADSSLKLDASVKSQAIFLEDMDLGTSNENGTNSQSLELKSKLRGDFTDDISFLLEARALKNYGAGGSYDEDTGQSSQNEDFLEMRQYWVDFQNPAGIDLLSVRLGRQRIREDYGLWWNRDIDAVKVTYDATLFDGFIAIGQDLAEYRTSNDTFLKDDEQILRIMGEASRQWTLGHYIEARALYQDDHSGMARAGALVISDNYDRTDSDLLWGGLRLRGDLPSVGQVKTEDGSGLYRVDLMGVVGEDNSLTSTAGPGVFRTVTGYENKDVQGWAADVGIDVPVQIAQVKPVIHAGYAYGSGDGNASDGTDHAFRQTGLDGNSSRLAGYSSSVNNYGSVLRPDLSNIHIATLGLTVPVSDAIDLAGFYRYYALANSAGGLASSAISAPLNGQDSSLGQGVDFVVNTDIDKQLNIDNSVIDGVNFKATLGGFRAGDAYGSADGEMAYRAQLDLSVRF